MSKFLVIPLIAMLPSVVDPAITPVNPFKDHYLGTKAVWDSKMGQYTPDELDSFVKATWLGTDGNKDLCKTLASISILECGDKIPVRDKTGHLGGHRCTIRVGAKEAGIKTKFVYRNTKKFTAYERTLSLSKHFSVLYKHYNHDLEKTCRVWNQGPKWKSPKALKPRCIGMV